RMPLPPRSCAQLADAPWRQAQAHGQAQVLIRADQCAREAWRDASSSTCSGDNGFSRTAVGTDASAGSVFNALLSSQPSITGITRSNKMSDGAGRDFK